MDFTDPAPCAVAGLAVALIAVTVAFAEPVPVQLQGDAARGKTLYQGCTSCHSLDDNDVGPKHRGVVGRKAGSIPDYTYSAALKTSGLTWDAASLDRWLTNPQALVPGTKMFFQLADPQNRADVIAYLSQQK